MPVVLHLLPHRGGGAETYIDLLEPSIKGWTHRRRALSVGRSPAAAAVSIPIRAPGLARELRHADLVHVHGDVASMLALPVLRRRPAVLTTHGLHLLRRARRLRRPVARALAAAVGRAAFTACTSEHEARELAEIVPEAAADRLVVAPNAVHVPPVASRGERAAARAALGLSGGSCAVVYAGQLEPRKDPMTAVRAAELVGQRGVDVVLLVAGDGPLRRELDAAAGPRVRVLGYVSDVDRLLTAADVFVLPSSREGLSFALLEAMARGVAPVVSDGAGNEEAVGGAGIVFPLGNVEALAEALARLAGDTEERARLGEAARQRVGEHYSVERLVRTVAELYDRALGVHSGPTGPARADADAPA